MLFRSGRTGPEVVVLHGGPAAAGSAYGIAAGLADAFRVLEPWQRGAGEVPLTVAVHVADLHHLITTRCDAAAPAIVGQSWGAMLALAYAAVHPDRAGPLVLVGCGTFDPVSRTELNRRLDERLTDDLRRQLADLDRQPMPDHQRMLAAHQIRQPIYEYDPLPEPPHPAESHKPPFDMEAHNQTWRDMLALQVGGLYPNAFRAIRSPVLMVHGEHDPHPGALIRDSLTPHIPHLFYQELPRCGHSPWRERHAQDVFFRILREWLSLDRRS